MTVFAVQLIQNGQSSPSEQLIGSELQEELLLSELPLERTQIRYFDVC